jgi:hypothetical protein
LPASAAAAHRMTPDFVNPFAHEGKLTDLELLFNYTFSKALDDGQTADTNGTFFGTDGVLDPYNLRGDYGRSDLDQRHCFVGSIIWQPTYAKDMESAVARQLLNGWTVSSIITAATGHPTAQ